MDESEFSSLTHLNQVGVFLEILSLDSVQGSNLWSWVEPGRLFFSSFPCEYHRQIALRTPKTDNYLEIVYEID